MSTHDLLVLAVEVLVVLLVLTLAVTYGHSIAGSLRRRLYAARITAARHALAVVADTGTLTPEGAAAQRRLPFATRVDVVADIAPSLAGEPRVALTRAARETGLIAGAERRCASRSWRRRFRAVRLLTVLGGGEDTAPPLLSDQRIEVRTQAAQWAVDHPTPENVATLVAMLGDDELLARFTVQDALTRIGRTATPALAATIRTAGGNALLGALRVARGVPDQAVGAAARERADHADPRVRASVAILLGQSGGEEGIACLERMIDDDDAAVRAAAVAAIGRLGHWPAAARLAACLRDRDWEVRRQAALALRGMGSIGTLLLRRALRDEDRLLARDRHARADRPELACGGRGMNFDLVALAAHGLARIEGVILAYFSSSTRSTGCCSIWPRRRHRCTPRRVHESRWRLLGSEPHAGVSMLRPGLQRGGGDRRERPLAAHAALPELRGRRRQRRLDATGRSRRCASLRPRAGQPERSARLRRAEPVRARVPLAPPPRAASCVDKENGGKADALNAGLNAATVRPRLRGRRRHADRRPRRCCGSCSPFLDDPRAVSRAGGIDPRRERLRRAGRARRQGARAALAGSRRSRRSSTCARSWSARVGWSRLGGNADHLGRVRPVPARRAVEAVGGYRHDTVGEDMELVVRLHRPLREHGRAVPDRVRPRPGLLDRGPRDAAATLARQRGRWQRGLAEMLWRHRGMLFNPRYGALGLLAVAVLRDLRAARPAVEFVGLVSLALGLILGADQLAVRDPVLPRRVRVGLAADDLRRSAWTSGRTSPTAGSGTVLWLLVCALVEGIGYRQLTTFWRLKGIWNSLRGRSEWGQMTRAGFGTAPEVEAPQ